MTRFRTAGLLAALAFSAGPALAQDAAPHPGADTPADAAPLAEEQATDIQVVDGVPVNPELRELLSQNPGKRSLDELIAASNAIVQQQQQALAEQQETRDAEWMNDPFNHLEGEMGELVLSYDDGRTDQPVQDQGTEVVEKLDQLIALIESMCES